MGFSTDSSFNNDSLNMFDKKLHARILFIKSDRIPNIYETTDYQK